ncbi:MAG TPA: hypothetical protein V6D04_10250 [Candidatus Obscuribacterales bacterium]
MRADIKAEWLARLRDGSFKQGRYQLRDMEDHFDAVGVLMDLAVTHGVIPEPVFYGADREAPVFFGWRYGESATRATREVWDWAEIGQFRLNHIQHMNDKGSTFLEIADYIEENF